MKEFICKNCGAIMVIDPSSLKAICHYCGAEYVLDRKDTDFYLDYYRKMQSLLAKSPEDRERMAAADELWERAETVSFETREGNPIEIRYMHKVANQIYERYVARNTIVYIFENGKEFYEKQFRTMAGSMDYPSADVKSLSDFFPKFRAGYLLSDGRSMMVLEKNEDEYPLSEFGTLPPRHVAWIISRLENLCCVLEFNSLVNPSMTLENIFINPFEHTAMLYGGFENTGRKNASSVDKKSILKATCNTQQIRALGLSLLGEEKAPKSVMEFLNSKPKETAFDDFSYWDKMMLEGFGERKFIKMDTNDDAIYNKN